MSQPKINNRKTVTISSDSNDYKNITVVRDELNDRNTHNIVYRDGNEFCKCVIRLDARNPLRVIGGLESRVFDSDKKKYEDDTFSGNFNMGVCLYADADKPTDDEKKIKKFLDDLSDHIIKEYSKELLNAGINMTENMGDGIIIPHEKMVSKKFAHIVKQGGNKNGMKYSDTFKLSFPVKYSISLEARKAIKKEELPQHREVWKLFKNKMGDEIDPKELHPQKLKNSKKNLFIRTHIMPDRITYGDGLKRIKLSARDTYCYFRKYKGGENQSKISDFKNAVDFNEEDEDEEQQCLSDDE